jgi:hypothetical protein
MADEVPAPLRSFIADHIGSLVQLELLLLLAADPQRDWNADEAAKALFVAPDATYGFLEAMRAHGLCAVREADNSRYFFSPADPSGTELVHSLAELYKQRRLTVTELIFKGPVEKYQTFANAFRFRRDK